MRLQFNPHDGVIGNDSQFAALFPEYDGVANSGLIHLQDSAVQEGAAGQVERHVAQVLAERHQVEAPGAGRFDTEGDALAVQFEGVSDSGSQN